MAKQVQVLVVCDWCKKKWQTEDEEAPEEREWSWNGFNYIIDLCEPCKVEVREHLKRLYEASEQKKRRGPGRPPNLLPRRKLPRGSFDKYKNEEGKYICPHVDGLSQVRCEREFDYAQHLGNHHNRQHGFLLD